MKKLLTVLLLVAMLVFSIMMIAVPITRCEDEDPIHIYYAGNKISNPPGPIVWTGPCTAESFTITVTIKWDNPPVPPPKDREDPSKWVSWVVVEMVEKSSYGMTFVPLTTTLYNPEQTFVTGPDYMDVIVTVPVAGLPAGTYAAQIYAKPTSQGLATSPTVSGTDGYFQFVKEYCPSHPPPEATISGVKFHDLNANGVRDDGEEGLEGWTIELYKKVGDIWEFVTSTTTDDKGDYIFKVDVAGHYKITEVLKTGWMQTAPSAGYYEFDVALGKVYSDNDFGNIKLGSIRGSKFYDAKLNGVWDTGEVPIVGWKVHLTGTDVRGVEVDEYAVTDASGEFIFKDLLPGTYTVTEIFPTQPIWVATTATSFTHVLEEGEDYTGPSFGNICLEPGHGGLTLGFWSNKNGQALITSDDVDALNGLNLYRPLGWEYPPFSTDSLTTAKAQIRTYLLSANAKDMGWMLSAQLIATKLNVLHNFLSGSTIVYVGPSAYVLSGFISINEIMSNANNALSSGTRAEQEYWKNLLDGLNNNRLPFVCPTPCPFTYP